MGYAFPTPSGGTADADTQTVLDKLSPVVDLCFSWHLTATFMLYECAR